MSTSYSKKRLISLTRYFSRDSNRIILIKVILATLREYDKRTLIDIGEREAMNVAIWLERLFSFLYVL